MKNLEKALRTSLKERYSVKNVGITGIGSYVPEKIVSNFELEKWLIHQMSG